MSRIKCNVAAVQSSTTAKKRRILRLDPRFTSSRLLFPDRLSSRVFIFIQHKLGGRRNHSWRGRRDLLAVASHLTRHVDSTQIVSDKDVLLEIQLKKSALLGGEVCLGFADVDVSVCIRFEHNTCGFSNAENELKRRR